MWLKSPDLSNAEALAEFDQWVTPSLGDIRETARFKIELDGLLTACRALGEAGGKEGNMVAAVKTYANETLRAAADTQENRLRGLLALVYLATAKSDNAVKCQYPITYGRRHRTYPTVTRGRVVAAPVKSVLKSDDVIDNVISLSELHSESARGVLEDYLEFLLASAEDELQLSVLVQAVRHCDTARPGSGSALLAPLVAFQVRGSVAASGGHDPERIVREHLAEWGLESGLDFNVADMTAGYLYRVLNPHDASPDASNEEVAKSTKTRAFDFILPCTRESVGSRIFIQSQFYAGDSGSVSHKNVDQAAGARRAARELFPSARFVELVDGAGYCASLRRDLQHLIFADDTHGFVQLRSIPVRLRRLLQGSGVITPLDLALVVHQGRTTRSDLAAASPAFPSQSVDSMVENCLAKAWLTETSGELAVDQSRDFLVRRYAKLDQIISSGSRQPDIGRGPKLVLVPGYGPDFGVEYDIAAASDLSSLMALEGLSHVIVTGSPS